MTKENSTKLVELYPEMFSWVYKAQPQTKIEVMYNNVLTFLHKHLKFTRKIKYIKQSNPYNYQFEVGDGWYPLLYQLILKIKFNDEANGKWITKVTQLKEKWGGLRFYVTGTSKPNWELIREAEKESFNICEETGSKEDVGTWTNGWVQTICKKVALAKYAKLIDEGKQARFDDLWKPISEKPSTTTLIVSSVNKKKVSKPKSKKKTNVKVD